MTSSEFDEDFYLRVTHNFKLYVLLSSKRIQWNEDSVLQSICRLSGYKCHKTVQYGRYSSHIHVKFEDEYLAREAVDYLNEMNSDLTAIIVDEMLRDWFSYEMRSGFGPPCTLTIVDTVGDTPFALNFLTSYILNSIFRDFGGPCVSPYTAAVNEPHVQVLFSSMTEALAACMAFGGWYDLGGKVDSFYHRVRINPSNKEALLITNSGGVPEEAFKLDYFLNSRSDILPSPRRYESESKQKRNHRAKTSAQSKGLLKMRKQKTVTKADSESSFVNHIGFQTPILCVPVITPINYTELVMATSGADFSNTMLNLQRSCSVSTRTMVASGESEMKIKSAVEYHSSVETVVGDGNSNESRQHVLPLEQELAATADAVSLERELAATANPVSVQPAAVSLKQGLPSTANPVSVQPAAVLPSISDPVPVKPAVSLKQFRSSSSTKCKTARKAHSRIFQRRS